MGPAIVIAAGGTAGHVYPGLALADAILRTDPAARISFVGTSRGIERDAVPAAGYPLHVVEVIPWARNLGPRRYLAPASLLAAAGRARGALARLAPAAVVGMGGYASLPVVVAARTRGIPAVLHEQNAIPGIANVVGARFAGRVALAFEEARESFPARIELRVVGNPIREEIVSLDRRAARADGMTFFGLDPERRTVLIMGGSLGAARLNEAAAELADRWRQRADVQLLVSAGRTHGPALRDRLAAAGTLSHVRVFDYVERVDLAYAAADLVVCRAGAATVAELAAVGLPSILVPYPYARANHQEANARAQERRGGARVLLDAAATPGALGTAVEGLLFDRRALETMGEAARRIGRPRAAEELGRWALALAEARR